jgi:hypothetical protein
LLLTGVEGPRRWASVEPFIFSAVRAEYAEPFYLEGDLRYRDVIENFWLIGDLTVQYEEPFDVDGDMQVLSEEPFSVYDGHVGVYDEGGVAAPQTGWFDRWGDD